MASETDFGPIRALFDPQSFAEKLFRGLKGSRESFDTKLLLMRLLSRVASCHELVLGGYYSFLGRYMQPHQSNVTRVLAYLVQVAIKNFLNFLINLLWHFCQFLSFLKIYTKFY